MLIIREKGGEGRWRRGKVEIKSDRRRGGGEHTIQDTVDVYGIVHLKPVYFY